MMLCVIGLPFNFCFSFRKNVSTFHLSVIAHAEYWVQWLITYVQEKYSRGNFDKKLANRNDYVLLLKSDFSCRLTLVFKS